MAAFVVAFLAAVRRWQMAPGERPLIPIIAPSRRQAAVVLNYAEAMIDALPGVGIARRTTEEVEVSTGVTVRIESASFRTPRGFSLVGATPEETSFMRDDSGANPDREIIRAIRPALASVPGSLLVAISTPYASRGMLFETWEREYGRDDSDILVTQAPTRTMNPTIPQRLVDRALEEDAASAAAEWLGVWRSDLESLFTREAVAAVTMRGRFELAPVTGVAYVAFIDPAGGSGRDSMTLAIAHRDVTGRPVLDLVREVRPNQPRPDGKTGFSPEETCRQFAAELKRYGCTVVYSDAYAGEWPREQFAKHGIIVQPSPLTRSELYLELAPMVNSGSCELLDHTRLLNQLADLERRTGASGRDSVDHRRGQHDDLANAAAGALVMAAQSVGLRAPMPADFTVCVNFAASAARSCAFLARGPHFPHDGYCRKNCPGLRAVWPVWQQYRQAAAAAGEPIMTGAAFLRDRFEANALMGAFLQERIEEQLGL
jgi:hypothetical protein